MTSNQSKPCPPDIARRDQEDPLRHLRDLFDLPAGVAYFDGNSLGALPKASKASVMQTLEQAWGQDLIRSWNTHNWIDLPVNTGEKIAPLLGAAERQVICCDSVSVNLYKLLSAVLTLRPGRRGIVSTRDNFPTDLYIASQLAERENPPLDLRLVEQDSIIDSIDDDTAVVMLTHVDYRSGRISDMDGLTQEAHRHGALVLWDLSHSVGALPLQLDALRVDLAVGCGYKYLNGGPGAPAFIYAARHLHANLRQPIAGWMGHKNPFDFDTNYLPADGIASMAAGTPPILSMVSLNAALDVFSDVSLNSVRRKSIALGELCQKLVATEPALAVLQLASPEDPTERGSQIAYRHPKAYEIVQALITRNVITDFRAPDLLRIGFAPLYTRFSQVFGLVTVLADIVQSNTYAEPQFSQRQRVT